MKKQLMSFGLLMLAHFAWPQGCSDAGICTINKAFQVQGESYRNSLEFSAAYSLGEAGVVYFSPYLFYTRRFNERFSFTSKVTYLTATGSFGTRSQFGDAYLVGNYVFKEHANRQWSVLLGTKLPFTASNLKINGYSLPLDYQSSLGTIDLFVGTAYRIRKWDFNAALQLPVVNLNRNSFFMEYSGSNDFPSTNLFRRQPDALLRATYSVQSTSKKLILKPSLLLIYHLGEDSFENIFGQRENIPGSDGLTINGNLSTSYQLTAQSRIELSLATPFVVRTVRPDGLTRSFVAGLQYQYSF